MRCIDKLTYLFIVREKLFTKMVTLVILTLSILGAGMCQCLGPSTVCFSLTYRLLKLQFGAWQPLSQNGRSCV